MLLSVGLLVMQLVAATGVQTLDPGVTQEPVRDRQFVIPPLIYREPPRVLVFRVEESIEMPCVASGKPDPTYKWLFNNEPFDPSSLDGRVAIQPGVGTLIFARTIPRDEGLYQCSAENVGGVSISAIIDLRIAVLEPFQPSALITHRPLVGSPLTLKCTPPRSFPKARISWATVREGETFQPINLTARVALDPEGSLHIAHVIHEDRRDGRTYACVAQNQVVRGFQQGDYQKVDPQGDMTMTMAPTIMWHSWTHQYSLREQTWRIKCIFSGRPTPRVDWERLDGKPMPNRARQESFGQELVIEKVQMDDAGKYECQGINDAAVVPTRRLFDLKVEASPYWKHKPQSRDAAEAGSTTFRCEAYGFPEPTYDWFINGRQLNEIPSDPRRIVTRNEITYNNLTRDDTQVIRCRAFNKHENIFASAYLNVLTEPEPPIIREPPLAGQKAAEDQTITLRSPEDTVAERSPWFYGMFGLMLLLIVSVTGCFFLKRVNHQRRSCDYTASYTSDKKTPINGEIDSDEEHDQRYNQPPYNSVQQQYPQDQYYGQQPQQYTDNSYGQPGLFAEAPGPNSYAQVPGTLMMVSSV